MTSHAHLNEEQMFELLEQDLDQSHATDDTARLHLAGCFSCRSEFATLRTSLANFRHAATAMALAQSPAAPPRRVASKAQPTAFRRYRWSASFATAVVLLATAVSVYRPHADGPLAPVAAPAVQVVGGDSDEALLEGIQQDLSTSIPPSLEPLAVPATSSTLTSN